MKTIKVLFLFICIFAPITVWASTNTFPRTKEKPLVPNGVVVDGNNIQDILRTPAVMSSEKVYDFGEVLTDEQERTVYALVKEYIQDTGIDCVIMTTRNMAGYTIDGYTTNFYRYNDFSKVGVIFVISTIEGQSGIFMKVMGEDDKVHSYYDDVKKLQVLRVANEYFTRGDYYATIKTYLKGIRGFYGTNSKGNYQVKGDGTVVKIVPWLELIILSISLTFIILLVFLYRILHKTSLKMVDDLDGKIDRESFHIQLENENYLGIFSVKKK